MKNVKIRPEIERRSANYELLEALKPFAPCQNPEDALEGTSSNVESQFDGKFDNYDGKWETRGGIFKGKPFYEAVSAPMLLARLCAGFEGLKIIVEGQPGYKVTWCVMLVHTESGNVVRFWDYKGACSVGSNVTKAEGAFLKDLKRLLLALVDDRFPHPYDGCRVGEIA